MCVRSSLPGIALQTILLRPVLSDRRYIGVACTPHRVHARDMADGAGVDDAGGRRAALAAEIVEREKDGWWVVDQSRYEVVLVHEVRPPWWLLTSQVGLGIAGMLTRSNVQRWLHIEALESGDLQRSTLGDIPRRWPRSRVWEVPDGVVRSRPRSQ